MPGQRRGIRHGGQILGLDLAKTAAAPKDIPTLPSAVHFIWVFLCLFDLPFSLSPALNYINFQVDASIYYGNCGEVTGTTMSCGKDCCARTVARTAAVDQSNTGNRKLPTEMYFVFLAASAAAA